LGYLLIVLAFLPASWADEQEEKELELSLADVIDHTIRFNTEVEQARFQWAISLRKARAVWGDFEPEIAGHYDFSGLDRQNTIEQVLAQGFNTEYSEDSKEYGIGIEGKTLSGGTYRFGYSLSAQDNSLASKTEYQSFAGVSAEQPLLKGAAYGAPMASIRIGRSESRISYHEFRKQLMDIIYQTELAYWNLVYNQAQYDAARQSVGRAEELVRDTGKRVEAGKMTDLDLLEAETGLGIRKLNLDDSRQNIIDAATQLKLLISHSDIVGDKRIVASEALVLPTATHESSDDKAQASLEWALHAQPDYLIQTEELKKERIVLGYQMDRLLPELNVTGSYGCSGLGSSAKEATEKLGDGEYPTWSVGVELRIPLFLGIRERNELSAARIKNELAEKKLVSMEYKLTQSIATLIRRNDTLAKHVINARAILEFRQQLVDIELARLEAGKSKIRLVYDAEEKLLDARLTELESILKYREAEMQLAFFCGSLLRDKDLEWLEDGRIVLSERIFN
jgi:outer membrane protein TolC